MAPAADAILARLTRLHPKSIDLSLGRIERLLAKLGRPDLKLAPVIHVAGTNGKGSTVAYIGAALRAAGFRVQTYTSPHLIRFAERIRLVDGVVSDRHLTELLAACERANGEDPITFFEITTAAAFLAFAEEAADFVLLEVGLGGRLDATNVIDHPLLTAITPVSLDHQGYLGNTISLIAGEKAGILKPGVRGVIGPQAPAGQRVIAGRAKRIGAPLLCHSRARREGRSGTWSAWSTARGIAVRVGRERLDLPRPGLLGVHQVDNAGLAVACLKQLPGVSVSSEAIAQGVAGATWPARMQPIDTRSLAVTFPMGTELWYDGGHNPSAARALARTFAGWAREESRKRPLHVIAGLLQTKDARGFIAPLARIATTWTAIDIPGAALATPVERLADLVRSHDIPVSTATDLASALARLADGTNAKRKSAPPRILITGSLYLAPAVAALSRR